MNMPPEKRAEFISGAREFLDFLEAHPELPIGNIPSMRIFLWYILKSETHEPSLRLWARAFGTFKRTVSDYYFELQKSFGGFSVTVQVDRNRVCKKVKKLVEVESWECPESLLEEAQAGVPEAVAAGNGI